MTWLKHRGDRWFLFENPDGGHVKTAAGAVERIGIAYHAIDRNGALIGKRSLRTLAQQLVEAKAKNGSTGRT